LGFRTSEKEEEEEEEEKKNSVSSTCGQGRKRAKF